MTTGGRRWNLVNPLPRALAHYEIALRTEVGAPLAQSRSLTPDFEIGDAAGVRKALRALPAMIRLLRSATDRQDAVVVWPAFGLAELALWRLGGRRARRLVIVHDPEPLRAQVGYGRLGTWLGQWGSRGRAVEVVVHTHLAADALEARGIAVRHVLPHPVLTTTGHERAQVAREVSTEHAVRVLVLGQHKPARDLDLLADLARVAPAAWTLRIAGRGWPDLPGWDVTSEFLAEEQLLDELAAATVVLLPYEHYFQSGIATRAFEQGVPVVGRPHEFLESLFGSGWIGLFEGDDARAVVQAVERVRHSGAVPSVEDRVEAVDRWRAALVSEHQSTPR
jgi:hypothetical protein